ncbi:hypothetical protein KI688_010611 [Linnemannia hyalina]|uniref:Pentatricopeptide repeat-containing protein-mitochondrial domain-containing protein n=1 Tax=Linnemannia hyalina TaxID=64524 RepID=A0A9P7XXB3_9FUNG|nr:hypothetical protein KI688_010611 [Linnemannia hyalina]
MAAVVNRRAFLSNVVALSSPSSYFRLTTLKPTAWTRTGLSRSYSRHTKTKVQIETSELEQEIRHLEKTIAEQERKLIAKRAYDESIRETKQRSEAAQSVYKSLTSPIATTGSSSAGAGGAPKQIGGHPNAQSYLPETFLQDLKLTFLDTRADRSETVRKLQSGLPTSEDLRSAAAAALGSQEQQGESQDAVKEGTGVMPETGLAETIEKDSNQLAFERVRDLGVDKWNQLIYVNALEGNTENAEKVMRLMEEVGVQPDLDSFTHLMEAYYNAGELKKAQSTIEMMLNNGIVPSMPAFNSLLKIHVRRRDITGAFQVFEVLKKHHNPDVEVFTNLVKGCLRADEYDLGWKVFDQMQRSGATPVENTYSLMIRACAKTDQVERALDIFRTYPTRKLQPTDATFNSLIHACAMRPEYFTTAFALLNEMQSVYGFEPDILTYNTLLFACSKRQDLLTARRVFQKVVQLDSEGILKLDGVTVTNFLWCVTEWKNTDVHLRSFKLRHRNNAAGQIESPTTTPASVTESATTDISLRPSYFLLPERPPANEHEALLEGESVFSWFVSRAASEAESTSTEDAQQQDTESSAVATATATATTTAAAVTTAVSTLPLPHLSSQSPIRARLLNAYLAMYVRHNSIEKSTEIYRQYFDHFGRTRDSWTYSTMLEGCYHWKDVDLGAEVFRDWRDWRMSTGKLTEKRTRYADYQCYRRMINLLARTNHLDESIALLEELAIAATPTNTRLRSEIASAAASASSASPTTTTTTTTTTSLPSPSLSTEAPTSPPSALTTATTTTSPSSLLFLTQIQDESVLPIYPQLKDFPIVYTKTWELEDESARRLLLRLCHSSPSSSSSSKHSKSTPSGAESDNDVDEEDGKTSIFPMHLEDKRRARYQKSLRNTAIKWKGEHSHGRQEKGFMVGERRLKELERDSGKRAQDHRRSFKGPRF